MKKGRYYWGIMFEGQKEAKYVYADGIDTHHGTATFFNINEKGRHIILIVKNWTDIFAASLIDGRAIAYEE